MSSVYQPKRKELAKVKVVSSEVYSKNRKNFNLVGSIQKNLTNFVTTQRSQKTGKCTFIDDTSSLTKRTKNDVVKFFMDKQNKQKEVVYLFVPKDKQTVKRGKK